mmetsp:Transcript_17309/g.23915  ORF Transcript_17309/g.23915 Transcript_17309/m.23915 type:complete len:130 (+) Transcript_17309:253-642(+)|eukprot:CAMPEP_0196576514 /NCGR_PEP_ID=MMETSP1081-20130531/5749_1 /TAXON_ID=36882 /ORGANISM="Pyramimonas amylifera, Strain CCMP720" /LENGTH=129 /DNA_ID=CAMNT_0041895133 /DNA_START=250 /DNA_END=639 /DNA_ORIENTATION=-
MDTDENVIDVQAEPEKNENEEDIYDDLFTENGEGETLLRERIKQLEEALKTSTNENENLKESVKDLESEVSRLSEEREILVTNLSCIFKTARSETLRKDRTIAELRRELADKRVGESSVFMQPKATKDN